MIGEDPADSGVYGVDADDSDVGGAFTVGESSVEDSYCLG